MNKNIETIIVGALLNKDIDDELLVSSFKSVIQLTLEGSDIFSQVPDEVFVSMDSLREVERLAGSKIGLAKDLVVKEEDHEIKYYKEEGALLYDGLHASAFGTMNYIYRSKGVRVYVFRDSEIKIVSPYCTIDHDGFQLKQDEVDSFNLSQIQIDDVIQILTYVRSEGDTSFSVSNGLQLLIRLICNIKKVFPRDYYLEYLLTPPDVDKISNFSKTMCFEMWQGCLSTSFGDKWGNVLQDQCINLLSTINISLSPGQIIKMTIGYHT